MPMCCFCIYVTEQMSDIGYIFHKNLPVFPAVAGESRGPGENRDNPACISIQGGGSNMSKVIIRLPDHTVVNPEDITVRRNWKNEELYRLLEEAAAGEAVKEENDADKQ